MDGLLWMGQHVTYPPPSLAPCEPIYMYADTRRQLIPTLVSHLISHMDHRMLRSQYNHDNRSNQEVVHCVGLLLSHLSDHQLKRLIAEADQIPPPSTSLHFLPLPFPPLSLSLSLPPSIFPSPLLCTCRSAGDVQFVVPLMYPLLRLCKDLPQQNKLAVSQLV